MGPAWRRGRDSNPRYSFGPYTGLANQRLQPLGHLSSSGSASAEAAFYVAPPGPSRLDARLRSDVTAMRTTIAAAITSEELIRPSPSPPSGGGLVSVSPSVAPQGPRQDISGPEQHGVGEAGE